MKSQDIPAFTPHDLRRTAATLLSENGWSADVVDKALNHKMQGTRGTYIKSELIQQRKEMLQFWADHLDSLLSKSNVILGRFVAA
jgi:integrase